MGQLKTLNQMDFTQEVEASAGHFLVWFTASWDKNKVEVAACLKNVAPLHPGINFLCVDCNDSPELLNRFSIRKMPTYIFFVNGKPVNRLNGFHSDDQFKWFIELVLSEYPLKK